MQLPPVFGALAGLDIPAGEKDYTIHDSFVLPVDVKAFGAGAHAHYIAKDMHLTATFPDGTVKNLLWIEDWDFAWQEQYPYKDLRAPPEGHAPRRHGHLRQLGRQPAQPQQSAEARHLGRAVHG